VLRRLPTAQGDLHTAAERGVVQLDPDPLHAMQFRPSPPPQVSGERPAQRSSPSDRECPLDTIGDRCLWHVGGTAGEDHHDPHVAATAPS
jgi:hypothetical protein